MIATEELRALLDERGVEYEVTNENVITIYRDDSVITYFHQEGKFSAEIIIPRPRLNATEWLTPDQVIEATFGRGNVGKYVGLRRGKHWERTENSDYYCGGCGWKVTDHDSYCPECGGALHKATLGQGTCRNIGNPPSGFLCSECRWGDFAEPSHLLTTAKFTDNDGGPNYCPNCGRKVISE